MIRTGMILVLAFGVFTCLSHSQMSETSNARIRQQIQAALLAQQANRLEEAAAGFEAVLREVPELAEAHMSLGAIRHSQSRYSEAIPEIEKALRLQPELRGARAVLGLDYFQIGAISKAVEQLELAVKEDPSNADVGGRLGTAYVAAGRFRAAVPYLEGAAAAHPLDAQLLASLARAYAGATDEIHGRLLTLAASSPEAGIALAQAYAASGSRDEAIEAYQAVLAKQPQRRGVNGAIGDLYMDAMQPAEAEKLYTKELELAPDDAASQFRMGLVLTELGHSEEALPYLQRTLTMDPANGQALFYLGKVQFDLGRMPEAEVALKRALEQPLAPKWLRSAHYYLATVCRRMGKSGEAASHLAVFKQLEAEAASTGKESK